MKTDDFDDDYDGENDDDYDDDDDYEAIIQTRVFTPFFENQ